MKVIISGRGQYIILSITKIVAERMKEYALFHCLNRSMSYDQTSTKINILCHVYE